MIIAQRGSQRVVRNFSYFTNLQGSHVANADPDELDDDVPANNCDAHPAPRRNPVRNRMPPQYIRRRHRQ